MTRLGKAEVAKKIGVKMRTLEYMVYDGEFPPGVKIGQCRWWLEEVVDAWLEAKFAGQREWMRRVPPVTSGEVQAGHARTAAKATQDVQPPPGAAVTERREVISTTLRAAGVPAPVRLV